MKRTETQREKDVESVEPFGLCVRPHKGLSRGTVMSWDYESQCPAAQPSQESHFLLSEA